MSHILTYLGRGGCLSYMRFKYRETRGFFDNFRYLLIVATLEIALRAVHNPLHKQPLRYIPCMNVNTVFTSGEQRSSFLDIAYLCHRLSTDSYLDVLMVATIPRKFSNFWWKFSFSNTRAVVIPCWTLVSKHLEEVLIENFGEEAPSSETTIVSPTMK